MENATGQGDLGRDYLRDAIYRFRRLKEMADKAIVQVDDEAFFATLGPGSNSIALILKHLGGNLRSRWRDFLTTYHYAAASTQDFQAMAEKHLGVKLDLSRNTRHILQVLHDDLGIEAFFDSTHGCFQFVVIDKVVAVL